MIRTLPITLCLTYFKSLTLANLEAALYSVRQQDMAQVEVLVVLDNDTPDSEADIQSVIDGLDFQIPTSVLSFKHGLATRTHAWSTNVNVRRAFTPWVFYTRADYILDPMILTKFTAEMKPNAFIVSDGYHLNVDVLSLGDEWQQEISRLRALPGSVMDYGVMDAGVWMTQRQTFDAADGLDEHLTVWGHAQTHFQHNLYQSGVEFVRIPEVLFYHPAHSASRDITLAHQQLRAQGIDIKELWARYEGVNPYASV